MTDVICDLQEIISLDKKYYINTRNPISEILSKQGYILKDKFDKILYTYILQSLPYFIGKDKG